MGKQLKRILQWKAVREVYASICKVYLKNENTCPFVQLQLQTEQISEGRSRCHCRAPWKKGSLETNPLQICRSWHTGERGVLKLMTSSQNSEIIAHRNWFISPFTLVSSFEKRVKKQGEGAPGRKSHKETFFYAWMELKKKLDELFQCWKKSIYN